MMIMIMMPKPDQWSRQRPTEEEVGLRTGSIHGRRWTRTLWCGWLQDPDFAGYTAEYTESI